MTNQHPEQLATLHQRLSALEVDLMGRLEEAKTAAAPVALDQTTVGRLSRMDALQQQAMTQASVRLAATQLTRVRSALQRMDHGTYGSCSECAESLDIRRLHADPCATLCQECQLDFNAAVEAETRRRLIKGRDA